MLSSVSNEWRRALLQGKGKSVSCLARVQHGVRARASSTTKGLQSGIARHAATASVAKHAVTMSATVHPMHSKHHLNHVNPAHLNTKQTNYATFATAAKDNAAMIAEAQEAASRGDVKRLNEISKAGADFNKGDFENRRPIHFAASEGHAEAVKFLLQCGVNVNCEDRWGNTPLDAAILAKHDHVLPILKSAGGTIGRNRSADIVSMLCSAAAEGNVQQLQRLQTAGVDLSLSDYDLRTPLHVACSEGRLETVAFLLKHQAKVNVMDRFGNTPLAEVQRSRHKNRNELIKLLVEHGAKQESGVWDIRRDPLLQGSIHRSLQFLALRANAVHVECWMPNEDDSEFSTTDTMMYSTKEGAAKLASFLRASTGSYPNSMQNNLGKAWQSKKPIIITDITEKDMPDRFKEAKACGLRSSVVVPMLHGGKQVCLLRFYMTDNQINFSPSIDQFATFAGEMISCGLSRHAADHPSQHLSPSSSKVFDLIVAEDVFSANLVYHELDWFYSLGLQKYYFERFSVEEIANHIHSFIAAKKLAAATGRPEEVTVNIESKTKDGNLSLLCMCPYEHKKMVETEKVIQRYIADITSQKKDNKYVKAYTLEFFKSNQTIIPGGTMQLGLYVLEASDWVKPSASATDVNIADVSSQLFNRTKTKEIKERYQQIMSQAAIKVSPLAEVFPTYRDGTIPIMFAFLQSSGTTTSYMLQLTELLVHNGVVAHRKFIETFANNIIVFSLYIQQPCPPHKIEMLLKQFSMLHLVPESSLTARFLSGEFSPEQYTYASAVSRFAYYFLNRRSEEFDLLAKALKNDQLSLGRLRLMQTRLKREAVSSERINNCVEKHEKSITELFSDFVRVVTKDGGVPDRQKIVNTIKSEASSALDEQILTTFMLFNQHMLKTNFYKRSKAALSFRLDPKFLQESDWPQVPFGLFFVMGSDFQGFHLRFRDIARGGIRVIRSADRQTYNSNLESLFAENFGLAYTQNKKNKDIPEFGSKGTILLALGQQNPFLCFQKYVSGLLDLIVPTSDMIDHYGKEELLFLGPDEGTAEYMEWAALYASKRGYKFWRSFTTGKPPSLGGIPHDIFGMTTRGVHRYVINCLNKLGLKEENVTKFQTGGPDGDLGSNEILLSKDRTLSIVDGSGVVHDPNGIDRTELTRLAKMRSTIKNFDLSKLSKGGFRVLTNETNVTLPNGEFIPSGLAFRNEFHLNPLSGADMFVPCGGRPESVNLSNVSKLIDSKGKPRFKIIVEGANLFFTNDARMLLENAGTILYKDASANKGGVTSSSLEVLAALALNADEFEQHMTVKDLKNPPKFYKDYVEEIQHRIETDADLEFECIWREHEKDSKTHRYLLTENVSDKINNLNVYIQDSELWRNLPLRRVVLGKALPQRLQELITLDNIIKRVPEVYLQAIFGAHLASRYVYKYGLGANEFAFFDFMQPYIKNISTTK